MKSYQYNVLLYIMIIFVLWGNAEWTDRFGPAKQVSLSEILDKPETWFGVPVEIPVRFAWLSDIYVPYRTRFSQDRFINFSAWDVQEQIWEAQGFNRTHPNFYFEKDNPELTTLLKLQTFDTVCLLCKVDGIFGGKPFIRVVWACKLPGDLNILNLRMLNQSLKLYQQRQFDEALTMFKGILDTNPPADIQAMIHKASARIYIYEKRAYDYAFVELKRAQLKTPNDPEIAEIFSECNFYLGKRAAELEQSWQNGVIFIPVIGTNVNPTILPTPPTDPISTPPTDPAMPPPDPASTTIIEQTSDKFSTPPASTGTEIYIVK